MSFENDLDTDPISATFSSRRIPHGRSAGGKGRGKGKGQSGSSSAFNPLRALGYYEVQLGSSKGKSKGKGGKGRDRDKHARQTEQVGPENVSSWLEIHQLTEGEDGFVGTFELVDGNAGGIEGMCLLAGSRKGLQAIVDELETGTSESEEEDEDEEKEEGEVEDEDEDEAKSAKSKNGGPTHDSKVDENVEEAHKPTGSNSHTTSPTSSPSLSPSRSQSQSPEPEPSPSALELADSKLNKRHHAFEKNSFRNPKFWIRWKGAIRSPTTNLSTASTPPSSEAENTTETETNQGYLIFTNNACDRFEGTISCVELGWDNVKISGWKVRAKATECTVSWRDF